MKIRFKSDFTLQLITKFPYFSSKFSDKLYNEAHIIETCIVTQNLDKKIDYILNKNEELINN